MATRLKFRDVVPYETPSSLDALSGPACGSLELPRTVHWGPRRLFDLDDLGQRRAAYRALVREGSKSTQETYLNEALLRREWPDLVLPDRCRAIWESAFPELVPAESKS